MAELGALFSRIAELDLEFEDTYVRLVSWSVESVEDSAQIDVEIAGDFGSYPPERWRVVAAGVAEWQCYALWPAGFGTHDPLIYATDHPLLWSWSGQRGELYFRGSHHNPAAVAAELYERHEHETGGWLPIARFANSEFAGRLRELLAGGHGLLASGPPRLLEAYVDVVAAAGFETSLLTKTTPTHASSIPEQAVSVITLGEPNHRADGYAYVVAAGFSSERLE
jgi:hypothetical protein